MDSFESWINPWFLAGSEKEMLWEPRVIESERETVGGFKEDEKGKRRACFAVVKLCHHWVLWWGWWLHWEEWIRVSSAKSWWFTEWLANISERGVAHRTKRMDPNTEAWGTPYMSCDGDEDELLTEVDWYLSERWLECSRLNAKNRRERRIWLLIVSKVAERSNKRRTEMLSLSRADCLQ